jgi:hypothetical protein
MSDLIDEFMKKGSDVNNTDNKTSIENFMNEKEEKPLRTQFSEDGIEFMKRAFLEGVVDIPDEIPIYTKDGPKLKIPPSLQKQFEGFADTALGILSGLEGGIGYTVGGVGDIFTKLGMDKGYAKRFVKDFMSLPDAFLGSPQTLMRSTIKKVSKPVVKETTSNLDQKAFDVGTLVREASLGNKKSIEKLIEEAKVNPEALAAAKRLGINLPPDVLAESQLVQQAGGLPRSIVASDASANWMKTIENAMIRADEIMEEIGGSQDLSLISEKVSKNLNDTRTNLNNEASKLFTEVDAVINPSMKVNLTDTLKYFDDLVKDLGGNINALTPEELQVFKQITNKKNPMTYRAFMRLKRNVYKAVQNKGGLFGDLDSQTVNDLYNVLRSDQLNVVRNEAGEEIVNKLKGANRLTVKYKALEDRIANAFGKEGAGSIASLLRSTLTTGEKGDITKLNKILKIIPENLRKESLLTALNSVSRDTRGTASVTDPFSFSKFSSTFERLKKQSQIYNILKKELGEDAIKVLEDLSNISNKITIARGNVIPTGKANQALVNGMLAENILEKFMQNRVSRNIVKSASVGGAGVVAGPLGSVGAANLTDMIKFAPKDKLKVAGELFDNPNFINMIEEIVETGSVSQNTINKLNKTPAYIRWAKTMGIDDRRNWLQGALLTQAEAPIPQPVEEDQSSDSLDSIVESISPSAKDKILQFMNQ